MTVVAAFETNGTQLLVGDMLVTADSSRPGMSFLSTAPASAATLAKNTGARIAGTRKKVHLFSDSIAVAWSGSLVAASSVLKELNGIATAKPIDEAALTAILAQQTEWTGNLAVTLTGWIAKPAIRCFRWNSTWPQEVFFHSRFFDGSGDDIFENLVDEEVKSKAGPGLCVDSERSVYAVLAKIGKLVSNEVSTGQTIRSRFGYCYDVAYFDGKKFRYVEEVTYLSWQVVISNSFPRYQVVPAPAVVKYKNFGDYSAVQVSRIDNGVQLDVHFDIVTPVISAMPDLDPRKIGPLTMDSQIYCNVLHITSPAGNFVVSLVNDASDTSFMQFRIRDRKAIFELNMQVVEQMVGLGPPV